MVNNYLDIISKAYDLLKNYQGNNGYIIDLKNKVYAYKNLTLNNFHAQFIINNINFEPVYVGKIVKMVDWWAKKQQTKLNLPFTPTKMKIGYYMGEAEGMYVFYAQFRQSQEKGELIVCRKEVILTDFLSEDYNSLNVDFDRYNKLAQNRGFDRNIREEQKTGIKFLLSRKKCILADDPGYGKTIQLIVAALEGNFDSILVICPASIKTNWKNEICYYVDEKYVSIVESFNDKNKGELEKFLGYGIGKSGKTREELLNEAKEQGKWQDNKFVIINFDILDDFFKIGGRVKNVTNEMIESSPMLKYIINKKSLIIIDEAHRLSNKDSNRYKAIKGLIKRGNPDSIYLATGTPITNSPENFFYVLDLLNTPVTSDWEKYMTRYCGAKKICHPKDKAKRDYFSNKFISERGKYNWYDLSDEEKKELQKLIQSKCRMMTIPQTGTNLEELKERVSHMYLRRVKSDIEGLVKKNIHEMFYDLSPSEEETYKNLWYEFETQKKEEYKKIKEEGGVEKELNKDLLEGAVYRKYISNIMVPHTIDIVDKLLKRGEKVVIGCCYDEELYKLKEYYKDACVIYNGKINSKQKDNAVKEFYDNANVKVFIGNITACGVGINLVNARYLIFNNIPYVPADARQMEDRIWRITQKRECHVVYQMFRNTEYEHIWNTIFKKELTINQVIKKENDK